jgi:hypothetical protein
MHALPPPPLDPLELPLEPLEPLDPLDPLDPPDPPPELLLDLFPDDEEHAAPPPPAAAIAAHASNARPSPSIRTFMKASPAERHPGRRAGSGKLTV